MSKTMIGSIGAAALVCINAAGCAASPEGEEALPIDIAGEQIGTATTPLAAFVGQAFHANTGKLWVEGEDTGLALKSGTSPAINGGSGATCVAATTSTGIVKSARKGVVKNAGTAVGSPSVSETGLNCFVAYRTTDNRLEIFDYNANKTTRWAVVLSSDPTSVVVGADNLTVAYRGSNGNLWTLDTLFPPARDWGVAVSAGTAPSVTRTGAGKVIAFRGTNGNLWDISTSFPATDLGLGVASGTRPDISSYAGNYVIAFTGSGTNRLWTYTQNDAGTGIRKDWGIALASGTRPSVRRFGGGRKILVQSSAGSLNLIDTVDNTKTDLKFGMAAGTSPAMY